VCPLIGLVVVLAELFVVVGGLMVAGGGDGTECTSIPSGGRGGLGGGGSGGIGSGGGEGGGACGE